MPRNITITFSDGTQHVYRNAPDTITPEDIQKRASSEFGKTILNIDGGRQTPPPELGPSRGVGAMNYPEPPVSRRESVRRSLPVIEPVLEYGGAALGAALGTGVGSIPAAGVGYSVGRQISQSAQEYAGSRPPESLPQRAKTAAIDVPIGAAMELGGGLVSKGVTTVGKAIARSGLAKSLYESAMKIPAAVDEFVRQRAIKTGLEGGYKVTQSGLDMLSRDIASLNKEIAAMIDSGKNTPIDYEAAVSRIDELKNFYKNAPDPKPYFDALDAIKGRLPSIAFKGGKAVVDPGAGALARGRTIDAATAQKMKQTIYALNKKYYGEMKNAEIEANKAIARGLKEELVQAFPDLQYLNAKDSALIEFEEFLERAVHRTRNYDKLKIADMAASTTGAVLGGKAGAVGTAAAKSYFESPGLKSKLAILLTRANKVKLSTLSRAVAYPSIKNLLPDNGAAIPEEGVPQ